MIYKLCKQVIENGNYEYSSMLNKLDVYLLANRIKPEEYTELKGLMDAQASA
ncbi:hypothetical protein [Desulfitobacterium sp. PCE1]|uniref:hypothetical protein n=1 Tax=Desulfitobacterium sp. PCE1 TaxID=146907 RepID=UPI0003778162|nr:hypothetical protein [Desulfitobacterium sp. PCE1]